MLKKDTRISRTARDTFDDDNQDSLSVESSENQIKKEENEKRNESITKESISDQKKVNENNMNNNNDLENKTMDEAFNELTDINANSSS